MHRHQQSQRLRRGDMSITVTPYVSEAVERAASQPTEAEYRARKARQSIVLAATENASLAELHEGWEPWKFQVCTYGDGDAYGRPGKWICTGMSNFLTEASARNYYDWINCHNAKRGTP